MSDEIKTEGTDAPRNEDVEPETPESAAVIETQVYPDSETKTEVETEVVAAAGEVAADVAAKAAQRKAKQARVAPLFRAFRGARTISGTVEKTIKGGYEIRIGRARAFCPHSQIDTQRVDDPESFIGTTHQFRITQLRRGGEDVVVSRRAVLEADRREEAAAVRATLIEGAVMLGRVSGLARFGAFVDLGAGVTGLVHITELSHGRINSVDQAVHVGEPVRVKILKLQGEHDRISLSIRQASEDPWVGVEAAFKSAQVVPGKVLRLADFGAFVELAPGVEALAPASEFPPRVGGWKDSLPVGSRQRWRVLKVDTAQRRISVTIAGDENEQVLAELIPGVEIKGRVQRVEKFGVFVWLGPGRVGLMPNVLTGTPPGTDLASRFPIAEEVDVEVVGVDEAGKIRLALKGAAQRRERTARAEPRGDFPRRRGPKAKSERVPDASFTDSSAGFGSLLADKLKDALG